MPGKKKQIRNMRKGIYKDDQGERASHKMSWGSTDKGYEVHPTFFPKKKNPSKKAGDWKDLSGEGKGNEAYQEAKKRKEVVEFKSKKRAERVAAGSWKKGKDKKEAMSEYRGRKKESRQTALKKAYGVK